MSSEMQSNTYQERVITVVGGLGQLGSRIVRSYQELGFREVRICEQGDPFRDFVQGSTDLFFAVDAVRTAAMLRSARNLLQPSHTVLDGASVKAGLIPLYRELDKAGISVCSTHLGVVPTQPWQGIRVWICEVGPNSERAKKLATELYIARNTSIQVIPIDEHIKVERGQWFTMVTAHLFAAALRDAGITLDEFNRFATLSGELAILPLGRILGQGVDIPTEVILTQPEKREFLKSLLRAFCELVHGLDDEAELREFLNANTDFHDNPAGTVDTVFRRGGVVGSRLANLRMYSLSFRIIDDKPGKLRDLLQPFYEEGVNLTAIDSMRGITTPEEEQQGVDPDRIVNFDLGIDLRTMDGAKERRIKEALWAMGCRINYSGHKLNR